MDKKYQTKNKLKNQRRINVTLQKRIQMRLHLDLFDVGREGRAELE